MNLLILEAADLTTAVTATIKGRRADHVLNILKKNIGETVHAGLLNGKTGTATLTAIHGGAITLALDLHNDPPLPCALGLILALPRPLSFKRLLQAITSFGIKDIHVIHSDGVEKSYWQSRDLEPAVIHEQCLLGLEQARDTLLPTLSFHRNFDRFIRDELGAITTGKQCLIAHPGPYPACPSNMQRPTVLVIGPESGFTEKELLAFVTAGFEAVQMGSRILRTETAVSALLGRLLPLSG